MDTVSYYLVNKRLTAKDPDIFLSTCCRPQAELKESQCCSYHKKRAFQWQLDLEGGFWVEAEKSE